ncbi:hypothetical protein PHLCEN_2v6455 [Hermanssonia centrifuga]|uniref:trans-L-3-hydroxyproline dehydratase n=1 Tax=Hermanssonia centrifuga TaxID=98765 RepID=A0A2R6NZ79_9APHY|nr:hypothetical protein PHLCEN_2v6455 [Hermanssonia centrifuga]
MCGHATIALGRFLIDAHDLSIFPRREQLKYDAEREETLLRLHAPCGVVQVRVPTLGSGQDARSDGTRRVSFKSVASFVSAIDVKVDIPESLQWTELKKAGRSFVTVDVSFGGAYYAIVSAEELGFERGIRAYPLSELSQATAVVKSLLRARKALFEHPSEEDLEYLYGVIIVEKLAQRKELGACFFADQQMDRSPCGSGVCACVALDLAKGNLGMGEEVVFESVVSMMMGQKGGFAGTAVERVVCGLSGRVWPGCVVRVQGRAFYTGAHVFVAEAAEDELADGFLPTTTPS